MTLQVLCEPSSQGEGVNAQGYVPVLRIPRKCSVVESRRSES